jgi:cation transport protein ChaC
MRTSTTSPTDLLTRHALRSEDFGQRLGVPADLRWTPQAIAASLETTLAARPPGALWVLAYGSLMWNPLLDFADSVAATLQGWRRSFCLRVEAGRGSPAQPGRMLALEPGGSTQCLALRLHEDRVREELGLLWTREMVAGAYRPAWVPVALADGRTVQAVAFLADPVWPGYEYDARAETVAPIVATASGALGSNAEYLHCLAAALQANRMEDGYIAAVLHALDAANQPAALARSQSATETVPSRAPGPGVSVPSSMGEPK